MTESNGKGINNFYRLLQRFRSKVVQDVPEDIQLCEFECHKSQCAMSDWEKCEKRMRSVTRAKKHN